MIDIVIVVTRYGGHRHLAEAGRQQDDGRFTTLCRGTSSWTLNSWARHPDHPFLTSAQMQDLPICEKCMSIAPTFKPEAVTVQSQRRFVAIISRRTVGWVEKAVGPFDTEAEAQAWLDSMHKPGGVVPMVVVS